METDSVTLKQEIADLRADNESKFAQILESFARLTISPRPIPTPLPVDTPRTRTARPASPPEFDGDRTKGKAFLNSCQTYIRLCPKEFTDEQHKILWAISYMKTGRAQKWADRHFRWEQQPENRGANRFVDWEDFREEFRKEFIPEHEDALAINRLETSAYYQKGRSLDDYLDEFQDLITDAGYTDPKTVVVKFRRGLNPQIQNVVATMATGRPSDANPTGWYDMARRVDQNRAANEAFMSAHRTVVPTPRLPIAQPARPSPVTVELEAVRRKPLEVVPKCFRCKKPGHFGRDCPDRHDIRLMSTDELQEEVENRLAQLDVAPASPASPSEEPLATTEDFRPSSE